jgi:hypothetical protein
MLRLMPHEQESSVHSTELGSENNVKTTEMTRKYLAVIYESTAC